MKKKLLSAFIALTMLVGSMSFTVSSYANNTSPSVSKSETVNDNLLRMWYKNPAPISSSSAYWWESVALPIGNGHMGGLVFGGITRDRIHFNDKTLWLGGPGTSGYTFGNRSTVVTSENLENFRKQLDNKSQYVFGYSNPTAANGLANMWGNTTGFGSFSDFCDVYVDFAKSGLTDGAVTNYVRDLDMTTAVASVQYDYNGVSYNREYFSSYPDNVSVIRMTASELGKMTFDVSIAPYTPSTANRVIASSGDTITYTGNLTPNGMQYEAQVKVLNDGGALTPNADGTISVTAADSVTLIFGCGTNYKNEYPTYRGEHPHDAITGRLNAAAGLSYDQLKQNHVNDHKALFGRVNLDLSEGFVPDIPTDELVQGYQRSLIPEQPYVNVVRTGTAASATVSGQLNTTYTNARIIDGNTSTIWISNNVSNPYATINLGSVKTFDMIQLACVTPEYILEYNTSSDTSTDVWEPIAIETTKTDIENEFQNDLLTFKPISSNKIRIRWDSTRIGLGNKNLMNRSLGELKAYDTTQPVEIPHIATDKEQRALEVMAYQMGRYLTIAGSRVGNLPTNLCGVWLIGSGSGRYWESDYHFNINVQMNYWPSLASNLAECAEVFNDYMETLRVPGRVTAEYSHGIKSTEGDEKGFIISTKNNPFGFTGHGAAQEWSWNPSGSIWALENVYDYYLFTGDVEYLRDRVYPMMRELAVFWSEYLWYSPYQDRLVVAPSISAEQGPTVNGATYDQSFVWQHFENTIQAAEILGVDADMIGEWREKQSKLNPLLIGDDGQIKEWFEETKIGRAKAGELAEVDIPNWRAGISPTNSIVPHRHLSHLVGLYPGTLISKDSDKDIVDAAMVSLKERGLGATSWSKSHKLNSWARMGRGEECYYMLRGMVGGAGAGFRENLLTSHGNNGGGTINYTATPIFQIDGNFGTTAGVNEMLLQSQLGYTQFLPAIPEAWANGNVSGLVARGNFVIDMKWSDGVADRFDVTSRNGGTFIGEYKNLAKALVVDSKGNNVDVTVVSADKISFETVLGETYTILPYEVSSFSPVAVTGTYAANVAIKVSSKALDGAELYLDCDGTAVGSGTIADGSGVLKIAEVPNVDGEFNVYAKVGNASVKLGTISINKKADNLWSPDLSADPETGELVITFAASVELKPYATVNIDGVNYRITSITSTKVTCDVLMDNIEPGAIIKISGVKFPTLFPSYSFAISINY